MSDFLPAVDPSSNEPRHTNMILPLRRPEFSRGLAQEDRGYSARGIFTVMGRHKSLIIGCVSLVTLISVIISFALPSRYVAQSMLILDTRRPEIVQQSAALTNLVSGSTADPAIVRGEVELLKSPAYARKVIDSLDLLHNPVFQRELHPDAGSGIVKNIRDGLQSLQTTLSSFQGFLPDAEPPTEIGRAIAAFQKHLTVYNDDRSYAISLRYESTSPEFATMIANSLAQLYLSDQLASKQAVAQVALTWLRRRLDSLQTDVRTSEKEVAAFQASNHLDTVLSGTLTEQRLSQLNAQFVATSTEIARKQADLAEIQKMAKSPSGVTSAPQVLASPVIQKLRELEAEAGARVAALGQSYSAAYPTGEPRTKEFKKKIDLEVQRIVAGLTHDIESGLARRMELRVNIQQEQAQLDIANHARVELADLQHKANTKRNLFDTLSVRLQQVESDEQSLHADARIVPAETPITPSFPRRLLFIAFGFFGSLFVAIPLAFFVDQLGDTIRTPEEAERLTGVPLLGVVPRVRNGAVALAAIVDAPLSTYSEAINHVLIALRSGAKASEPRVVAITSAVPAEGKTLISGSLARSAAASGTRTLLLDCDMRRPMVGRIFGQAETGALEKAYEEKCFDLSRFVQKDEESGLHYLSASRITTNPQELLQSAWLSELIKKLRGEYGLVLIDTPPLLTVSDGLLLSRLADVTLLVVRWGHTPGRLITEASRLLQLSGKPPMGTIFSLMDMRSFVNYRSGGYSFGLSFRRSLTARDTY